MVMIKTIQEQFIAIYFKEDGRTDVDKYESAVKSFEKEFSLKAPYSSYRSFKVTMTKIHREMRNS